MEIVLNIFIAVGCCVACRVLFLLKQMYYILAVNAVTSVADAAVVKTDEKAFIAHWRQTKQRQRQQNE